MLRWRNRRTERVRGWVIRAEHDGAVASVAEGRSTDDGSVRRDRLSAFDERMQLPIALAAILPILLGLSQASQDSGVFIAVNVVAWIVFVFDLSVHVRLVRGYLKSGVGIFDLSIVVLTAPWFLIPGLGGSQVLVIARLGRLLRLLFASPGARKALQRLGQVGIFAAAMLLLASWMAFTAEKSTNPGFATFGDSLWWGVVTLTTVGYGDIVPHTEKGRIAGVFLMVTGLATLGVLSGTMASFFRTSRSSGDERERPPTPTAGSDAELDEVRQQLAAIADRLAARR
jgi:voltage-gated potassium channel